MSTDDDTISLFACLPEHLRRYIYLTAFPFKCAGCAERSVALSTKCKECETELCDGCDILSNRCVGCDQWVCFECSRICSECRLLEKETPLLAGTVCHDCIRNCDRCDDGMCPAHQICHETYYPSLTMCITCSICSRCAGFGDTICRRCNSMTCQICAHVCKLCSLEYCHACWALCVRYDETDDIGCIECLGEDY